MTTVFFSYSHKDEDLRDQLEVHLTMLKREGLIDVWHDRRIAGGSDLDNAVSEALESTNIILLLVSSDFLASEYCYSVEMNRAIERHEAGEARVIPIILRPCDWKNAPFGKLLAAPRDGIPVTKWPDRDDAFVDIARTIRNAISGREGGAKPAARVKAAAASEVGVAKASPRSSNLRLAKRFSDADKDQFFDDAFEFMARFFENSLNELEGRNLNITGRYKRVDAHHFMASVYRDGKQAAQCNIRLNSKGFGDGITYSQQDSGINSYNESLSVEADDQSLYLRPLGMMHGVQRSEHLSAEGAAEFYWAVFIKPLQ